MVLKSSLVLYYIPDMGSNSIYFCSKPILFDDMSVGLGLPVVPVGQGFQMWDYPIGSIVKGKLI